MRIVYILLAHLGGEHFRIMYFSKLEDFIVSVDDFHWRFSCSYRIVFAYMRKLRAHVFCIPSHHLSESLSDLSSSLVLSHSLAVACNPTNCSLSCSFFLT